MDSSWLTPTVLFCFLNLIILCIFIASYSKSHNHSPHLNRSSSSLLTRVKSINFSFKNLDLHYPQTMPPPEDAPVTENKLISVSEPVEEKKKLSVSEEPVETVEKQEQVTTTTGITTVKERRKKKIGVRDVVKTVSFKGDEQVDAKADDFINRFKQQLKMQRIDSIKRYTDMLTGGARSANN